MFIDETWTKTNMAPLRGWAPRGQRIKAKVPHGRWQTMTFMAALRHDRITATWFIEGPINGEAFLLYIEKVLVLTLRHGDIVIMDNLGSHKASAVRRAIRAAGARLFYLPKYSPYLNPIEQFFSKLKHWLGTLSGRRVGHPFSASARSVNEGDLSPFGDPVSNALGVPSVGRSRATRLWTPSPEKVCHGCRNPRPRG